MSNLLLMSSMSDDMVLDAMGDMVGSILAAAASYAIFFGIVALVFFLAQYFVVGYAIMCTGRKLNVNSDFMPFIPVARQIYQMKIADCPIWYIFLFENTTITVGIQALVYVLISMIIGGVAGTRIVMALALIYKIANMVISFMYWRKFYGKFEFNPNAAWINIIPVFGTVALVFQMIIAFSNSIRGGEYVDPVSKNGRGVLPPNKGVIVGFSGSYKDAVFDLVDGAEITFGRDPQQVNIVFDQTQTDISRKHCVIRFDGRSNQYIVTDLNSTTGTYLDNGTRLEAGQPKQVTKGTVIYMGSSRKNGFRLN